MKETTANPARATWFRVRLPMRITASTTTAITIGWIPYSRPLMAGTFEWATASHESTRSTKIEGMTKKAPATIPPRVPCIRQPM